MKQCLRMAGNKSQFFLSVNRPVAKTGSSLQRLILSCFRTTLLFKLLGRAKRFLMANTEGSVDLTAMRIDYREREEVFTEEMLIKDPIEQFKAWFDEATADSRICEPNAMCLATCTKSGIPSARYVLLKGYGPSGFKFFTNYNSRKGKELEENPNAAVVFYWESLRRSIRIEGVVEKLPEEESETYFSSRPRNSQIGASCSEQSQPISNREALARKETEFRNAYTGFERIPKPKEWGGYCLVPHSIEFWQGQVGRLHDRIRFRIPKDGDVIDNNVLHKGQNGWVYERLQP